MYASLYLLKLKTYSTFMSIFLLYLERSLNFLWVYIICYNLTFPQWYLCRQLFVANWRRLTFLGGIQRRPLPGPTRPAPQRHPVLPHRLLHGPGRLNIGERFWKKTICNVVFAVSNFLFSFLKAVEQITDKTLENYETFLGKIEGDKKAFII